MIPKWATAFEKEKGRPLIEQDATKKLETRGHLSKKTNLKGPRRVDFGGFHAQKKTAPIHGLAKRDLMVKETHWKKVREEVPRGSGVVGLTSGDASTMVWVLACEKTQVCANNISQKSMGGSRV